MTLISTIHAQKYAVRHLELAYKCEGSVNMYSTGQDIAKGIQ